MPAQVCIRLTYDQVVQLLSICCPRSQYFQAISRVVTGGGDC